MTGFAVNLVNCLIVLACNPPPRETRRFPLPAIWWGMNGGSRIASGCSIPGFDFDDWITYGSRFVAGSIAYFPENGTPGLSSSYGFERGPVLYSWADTGGR